MVATAVGGEKYNHNFKSFATSKRPPECCKQSGHKKRFFFYFIRLSNPSVACSRPMISFFFSETIPSLKC